jgi:hypothetical protein
MNNKLLFQLCSWLLKLNNISFARDNIVNVNPPTGASKGINNYPVNRCQVRLPINLVYTACSKFQNREFQNIT